MATGKVKMYNGDKGFGFIVPDEGGSDMFMHISNFEDKSLQTISPGQRVSYEVTANRQGKPTADKVKCIDEQELWT